MGSLRVFNRFERGVAARCGHSVEKAARAWNRPVWMTVIADAKSEIPAAIRIVRSPSCHAG